MGLTTSSTSNVRRRHNVSSDAHQASGAAFGMHGFATDNDDDFGDVIQAPVTIQMRIDQLSAETRELCVRMPIASVIKEVDGLTGREAGASIPGGMARLVSEGPAQFGVAVVGAYAKLLVLTLIADGAARLERARLPMSIKDIYPAKFANILDGIHDSTHEQYIAESGSFARDLRIAAQLSVPLGGSRYIDRHCYLKHNFYRYQGKLRNLTCLMFIVTRLRGLGPLFRVHIDERDLGDYNSAGWDVSYLRVAEMLRLYPKVKGMVGSSWVLDPQLDAISPALGASRQQFVAHGAFLREDGSGDDHTEKALRKSPTRRRLYDEGKYMPSCYTFLWSRAKILKWARGVSTAAR